jgi:hypothetical protein
MMTKHETKGGHMSGDVPVSELAFPEAFMRPAFADKPVKTVLYLLNCAAMTNGCRSALAIDGPPSIDLAELDSQVPEDRRVLNLIRTSGWWMDHGRWVCGNHEPRGGWGGSDA